MGTFPVHTLIPTLTIHLLSELISVGRFYLVGAKLSFLFVIGPSYYGLSTLTEHKILSIGLSYRLNFLLRYEMPLRSDQTRRCDVESECAAAFGTVVLSECPIWRNFN